MMLELRWGAGGGPRFPMEPVEEVEEEEGDFLMGEPILVEGREEGGEDWGGGGKSRLLSGGGGGNSGDWGATCPPGCHFGLALTAGGDWGGGNLEPSAELEEAMEAPGNWLTICLTRDRVGEMGAERGRVFEEKLCCLGMVGGG